MYSEILVPVHDPDSSLLLQFRERAKLEKICLLCTLLAKTNFLKESLTDFQKPLRQVTLDLGDTVHLILKLLLICASLLFS